MSGRKNVTFTPLVTRDPAGELGTTEADMDTAEVAVQESVWPDWAPDLRDRIRQAGIIARFIGILLYVAALIGLGIFIGWVLWGQA